MKQLFSLMAVMSVIVFSSCQKETQSVPNVEPGFKNLSISINAGNDMKAVDLNPVPEEIKIAKLTVAVYGKDGNYVQSYPFDNVTGTITISSIPENIFPIKLFAVANDKGNAWAIGDFTKLTFDQLSTLTISHKTEAGKELKEGTNPLIMCGEVTSVAATALNTVVINMKRPVIRVDVTNNSQQMVRSIAFTGLNAAVKKLNYEMVASPYDFTLSKVAPLSNGALRSFYLMPQNTSATITVTSDGVSAKTRTFGANVPANSVLPISITDKSINIGNISIIVNEQWKDAGTIDM